MHTFQIVGGILILILVKKLFENRNAATANGNSDAASSSSATQGNDPSSSSFPSYGWDYEVFLSFRGEDTRTNFTDHLYNALVRTGIHTFRDNEGLPIGENIDPALRSAIHQSKIAIPIFSKDYASSKWCLRELAEIVECMNQQGQRQITVMPVFYHVDPSEVRHQIGCYEKAFQNHQKKYGQETEGWKKALKQVADLKGWDLKNIADRHEGKLIQLIVKEIWSELNKSPLTISDNLVGIRSHVEEMKKLLNVGSNDKRIVGIHGLGGIGKTTIARCVYNAIHDHFEGCSFIADARETFKTRGPVQLQCQLLINILNQENPNITSVDEGINMIKQRLSNKKVLIVVDDVDENTDLSVIIGKRDWFGIGSRIIITTRDMGVLKVLEVDNTYEPNELDANQSLKLFSRHAFKRDQPPERYLDLSKGVIKTAGGLPLALEVLGSSLVGKGESAWKDMVKKLNKIPNHKVLGKLRISYDGLSHEEKEMFLDIACFLLGMDKNIACYIWDGSDFFPNLGIEVLCQKSLVKIGKNNELRMHDQLRDLGREIVREENIPNPGERSRLWLWQEVLDVLSTQKGTGKVEGLCIDFGFHGFDQCLMSEGFASMTNLRLLQLNYARFAGNFVHSFSALRWLRWNRCPAQFTPTNLRKLVVLDLSDSEITEYWVGWNYVKEAETLKVLNLSRCDELSRTPDFSANLHLEVLNFEGCINLVAIHESIGHLKRLVSLNLRGCKVLKYISVLPSGLTYLDASGCYDLKEIPGFSNMRNLVELYVNGCSGLAEIEGLAGLDSLQQFGMDNCCSFKKLPKLLLFKKLTCLRLHGIGLLEIEGSAELYSLEKLTIDKCDSLRKIRNLSCSKNLVCIEIRGCNKLSEIEGLEELYSLEKLIVQKCPSLRKIPNLCLKKLVCIEITDCCTLSEIEGLEELYSLEKLIVQKCPFLRKIPKLSCSENPVRIEITDCDELFEIESLEELDSLQQLKMHNCGSFKKLLKLWGLKKLTYLELFRIDFSEIEGHEGLYFLEKLIIEKCHSLKKIPNFSDSENLVCIEIQDCAELSVIEGLEGLYSLEKLIIKDCHSLRKFPNLSDSKNLLWIDISYCSKLSEIEGLEGLDSPEELQLRIYSCDSLTKIHLPKKLSKLYISTCYQLSEIKGLEDLKALKHLEVWGLKMLPELPSVDKLDSLEKLYVSWCTSIEKLTDLSNLTELRELCIHHSEKLTEIQGVDRLENLEMLSMDCCKSIKALQCLSSSKKLRNLSAVNCENLTEIQGLDKLESLTDLCLKGCISIEALPCLSSLKKLRNLSAVDCEKLTEIQGLDKLESLTDLCINGCISIEALPCLSNLKELQKLSAADCKKLTKIQGVDKLESLTDLCIDGCISIEALPCLSSLKKLRNLSAVNCEKLTEIHGLDKLESLTDLCIDGCISIEALPCLSSLKKLRNLSAVERKKLMRLKVWTN